jgi:8-amino-7-oxononanoate synthase
MSTLDFSSALYLGWRHPGHSLGDWPGLTLGKPAALESLPGSSELAQQLARLQGCQAASLCSSTLHLFWDLFQVLAQDEWMIFQDDACYPVLGWGVERAAALGVPVQRFGAHAAGQLAALVAQAGAHGWRPMIVAEGYAPSLGRAAPLAQYAALAAQYGGFLVLDDTQSLGLFGHGGSAAQPWGFGGGGSLRAQQVAGPHIIVGSSLAKAFGAPLAVLAADARLIRRFEQQGQTRQHSSPPNLAALRAAQQALRDNHSRGDALRSHLWQLLQQWWQGVAALGLGSHGGPFPAQTLALLPASTRAPAPGWQDSAEPDWADLHRHLQDRGIAGVLRQVQLGPHGLSPPAAAQAPRWQLSFIFTAEHGKLQVAHLLAQIGNWLRQRSRISRLISREAS